MDQHKQHRIELAQQLRSVTADKTQLWHEANCLHVQTLALALIALALHEVTQKNHVEVVAWDGNQI